MQSAWDGATNPHKRQFSAFCGSFGSHPGSQRFSTTRGRASSNSSLNPVVILDRIVESAASSAVIEERNRLAREIHDTLTQEFAGILLHLEAAKGLGLTENASECVAQARELAKAGLEDARRILLGLRPKSLEGSDLCSALGQLAESFSRDCGIHCTFSVSGCPQTVAEEAENELYRVAQEALCNIRKHSGANSVSVFLSYTAAGVALAIKDNGQGFAMKQPEPGAHGFGLPAMCERASRLGGRMDINSGSGTGTEIRMLVPMSAKASKERNNQ